MCGELFHISRSQQRLDTGVVVVPALGVTATLDDTHVAQNSLNPRVTDVINTVIEDTELNTDKDCGGEVHREPPLRAADGTGTDAGSGSDGSLCSFASPEGPALVTQLALLEADGKYNDVGLFQGSA